MISCAIFFAVTFAIATAFLFAPNKKGGDENVVYATPGTFSGSIVTGTEWRFIVDSTNNYVSLISYVGSATNITVPTTLVHNSKTLTVWEINNTGGIFTASHRANVVSFTVPESVQKFVGGTVVFEGCTSLKKVEFLNDYMDIFSLSSAAFGGCTSLEELIMPRWPRTVYLAGSNIFWNCSKLRTLYLPSGVTSLPGSSPWFSGMNALETLYLPSTIDALGYTMNNTPFHDTPNLRNIYINVNTSSTAAVGIRNSKNNFSGDTNKTLHFGTGTNTNTWGFVSYDTQGGTLSKRFDIVLRGAAVSLPTPTRFGHSFGGWWNIFAGSGAPVTRVQITSSGTITAGSQYGTQYYTTNGRWDFPGNLTIYANWAPPFVNDIHYKHACDTNRHALNPNGSPHDTSKPVTGWTSLWGFVPGANTSYPNGLQQYSIIIMNGYEPDGNPTVTGSGFSEVILVNRGNAMNGTVHIGTHYTIDIALGTSFSVSEITINIKCTIHHFEVATATSAGITITSTDIKYPNDSGGFGQSGASLAKGVSYQFQSGTIITIGISGASWGVGIFKGGHGFAQNKSATSQAAVDTFIANNNGQKINIDHSKGYTSFSIKVTSCISVIVF